MASPPRKRWFDFQPLLRLKLLSGVGWILIVGSVHGPAWATPPSPQPTGRPGQVERSEQAPRSEQVERQERARPQEPVRASYLGRQLAEPMSHRGAAWLVRPERDLEENASRALEQLRLRPAMQLCDLGCGNGYWTLPLATAIGKQGKVYAVDIQLEMLQYLKARAGQADLPQVIPVLGDVDDPRLPADARLDLVLMVDVYHEFSQPESMLWAVRRSLADDGVVALLEYREEDPLVPIKPLHKMSKAQIMREYTANGFKLVREYNELPWQHLMFFARDDSPLQAIEPAPFHLVPGR